MQPHLAEDSVRLRVEALVCGTDRGSVYTLTAIQHHLRPGDLLIIHGVSQAAKLSHPRVVLDEMPTSDHVAIIHHVSEQGALLAIEGRPDGIGWINVAAYVRNPFAISNVGQLKSDWQRTAVCEYMIKLMSRPNLPGHSVVSSMIAHTYEQSKLDGPRLTDDHAVTPADWRDFIIKHSYQY